MIRNRVAFIAALAFLSAMSQPQCSNAGGIVDTWSGVVNYRIEYFENGIPVNTSSGSYLGSMSLGYDPASEFVTMTISGLEIYGQPFPLSLWVYGPIRVE